MSKSVRIDDDLYEKIEEFALKEDRPVANALVRLIKLGLGLSEPSENKKVEIPNGVGSQANKRLVATGNEPVRESLPDELEEAIQMAMTAKKNMMPENANMVCDKRCIDEGWSDEQYKYEYDKYISEQQEIYDNATAILKEHNVSIGI